MIGGGKFRLKPGEWTDDTSMTICLAESIIECGGFDADDQMRRYVAWANTGKPGPKSHAVGIGKTIFKALAKFATTGAVKTIDHSASLSAGNGALMRLAPVVLTYYPDREESVCFAVQMTLTTHSAPECLETSKMLACLLVDILDGATKDHLIAKYPYLRTIVQKPTTEISGSGYAPESLEAAVWSFLTSDSFMEAVLRAANLGDDADTTSAICGQLAGAYYGYEGIPMNWRKILFMEEHIRHLADLLFDGNLK
jgi:ADP-ribosyl-[dinitrogen reductase] hydrolase